MGQRVPLSAFVDAGQRDQLVELARREDRSVSSLVRSARPLPRPHRPRSRRRPGGPAARPARPLQANRPARPEGDPMTKIGINNAKPITSKPSGTITPPPRPNDRGTASTPQGTDGGSPEGRPPARRPPLDRRARRRGRRGQPPDPPARSRPRVRARRARRAGAAENRAVRATVARPVDRRLGEQSTRRPVARVGRRQLRRCLRRLAARRRHRTGPGSDRARVPAERRLVAGLQQATVRQLGHTLVELPTPRCPRGLWIAGLEDSPSNHVVVARDGFVVHDPAGELTGPVPMSRRRRDRQTARPRRAPPLGGIGETL
jgi:hypothetical protein